MAPQLIDEVVGVGLSLGGVLVGAYSLMQARYRKMTLEKVRLYVREAQEMHIVVNGVM